ncbi:MAG: citrate transporter [Lachnospiraceae bacterium]|nr:citrate transporter [Lachnospiraceae bacterium]
MNEIFHHIKSFVKNQIVLSVAFLLAVLSAFFVHPDINYVQYIDYRTLSILLCLMITMAGFQKLFVFRQIGEQLVGKMSSIRGVTFVLIFLCFFSAMFITNDVALLTFVPFTIVTLSLSQRPDLFIVVIVLETVAANLGSMLTPLGNPQNLYLYSLSGLRLGEFVWLMLPYSAVATLLLILFTFVFVKKSPATLKEKNTYERTKKEKALMGMYTLTFFLSILVVARVIPFGAGLAVIVTLVFLFDRSILKKPDYALLFTFVFLFVFIGNIKRTPILSNTLSTLVCGHEVGVSVILSQFISNVPAAILCSSFTDNIKGLIIGTNIGGLGTLIASMASLISYNQYGYVEGADKKKYIVVFTGINLIFLAVMVLL